MKQYRLEIFITSFFAAFLVIAFWNFLEFSKAPWTPYALLIVCFVPIVLVLFKTLFGNKEETERYAPMVFFKLFLSSVVGIVFFVVLAMVLSRPNLSKTIDITERKVHSLSGETIKFVKALEKPLRIICVPEINRNSRYCEENKHLLSLYAQTNPGKIEVGSVRLDDLATMQQVAPTGDRRLVLMLDSNRTEISGPITESKLTNGLINLTKGKKNVYFLTGNGEPGIGFDSDRSYSTLVEFLKKRGYEAKEHKLTSGADLPKDAEVVIAGSTLQAYPDFVEQMLRKYLARGGKLILGVNPYRELGLTKLLGDLGVTLDPSVVIGDGGSSQLGAQLAQANPMRPPVVLGEFNKVSDLTSKLSLPYGVADGARPITVVAKDLNGLKVKQTDLVTAFSAVNIPVPEGERSKISLDGPFALKPVGTPNPNQTYKVAYSIDIEGAEKLLADAPKEPANVKAQIVLLGFELIPKYVDPSVSSQVEIPLLAVSELYKDKDLVTIPSKDYAPKQFRMDRNPQSWLGMFAFVLPVGTMLIGLYIWMRRRSS